MPSDEPSPRPWSLFVHDEQEGGDGEVSICAEGEWIATMNLRRSTAKDDAALIVDAVNGRAALSAVLRDMAKDYEAAWEGTPLRRALAKYFARLREIAGEGETPTGKGVER